MKGDLWPQGTFGKQAFGESFRSPHPNPAPAYTTKSAKFVLICRPFPTKTPHRRFFFKL